MATKNITFDPDSGVPYGASLSLYNGSNFNTNFNVFNTANSAYNLTGYTGSAQLRKSIGTGSTSVALKTFTVGFPNASGGKFNISLDASSTTDIGYGRYYFDVLLTGDKVTKSILDTSVSVGQTVGIGTTSFTLNKISGVAIGDSMSVGSVITNVSVVGIATTTSSITIGIASTIATEVLPGTSVTFTRVGTASTIYKIVDGNIYVYPGISSAP